MKTALIAVLCFTVIAVVAARSTRSTMSTGAKGKLICDGKPVANGKVELYTERSASPDSLMATVVTNANGEFEVKGHSRNYQSFRPYVFISHHCRSEVCVRKFNMAVPVSFSKSGSKPGSLFQMGNVDLKRKFPTETKSCPRPKTV